MGLEVLVCSVVCRVEMFACIAHTGQSLRQVTLQTMFYEEQGQGECSQKHGCCMVWLAKQNREESSKPPNTSSYAEGSSIQFTVGMSCWKLSAAHRLACCKDVVRLCNAQGSVYGSQAYQNTGGSVVGRDVENSAADHRHRGSYIGSIVKQGSSHQAINGGVWSHKLSHR